VSTPDYQQALGRKIAAERRRRGISRARDWIEAHAVQIKPKTLQDYRHLIRRSPRACTPT